MNDQTKFLRTDKLNKEKEIFGFRDLLYSMGFNFVLPSEYGGYNNLRKNNPEILRKCGLLRDGEILFLEDEHAYWKKLK